MTPEIQWNLSVDALAEWTAEDGTAYQNVVETVHWRCTVKDTDTGESVTIYSNVAVPKPTGAEDFIDLSVLQGQTEAERRAIVLGWAEAVKPGFVGANEQAVADKLQAKLSEPKRNTVSIL